MSVYVDSEKNSYGRMLMCHMMADTIEELHQMADQIGIKREWFQDGKYPHYDLCQSKRKEAVRLGAKEVTAKEILKIARRLSRK